MCVEKQMFILANDIFGFLDFEFRESPQNVHLKCWQDTCLSNTLDATCKKLHLKCFLQVNIEN